MEMNYVFEGNGDKIIVFVHGLGESLDYWRVLSSKLNKGYKILLYDIRGHGNSPLGDEAFSIDMLVDDLHNLILKLNIKKTSLVGFSLGGNVILSFAIKYPDFVDKLIVMSSFSENDENLRSKFLEFRDAIGISYEAFFDVIIRYVIPDDVYMQNREVLEFVKKENARKANTNAIKYGIDAGIDFDVTNQLNSIRCPVMILAGRDDDIISLKLSEILNDNIKNSQLMIFDDTKHNLLIGKNISEILELMRKFL